MPFRRQLIWSKRLYFPFLLAFLLCLLTACAKQSPLPQAEQASEGVLLVAFGTSVPEAEVSLRAVDAAFKEAFPNQPIVWAYTSQIIRKKLAEQGRKIESISEGLANLARQGVKVVRVQALHVMAGEEFNELERALLLDLAAHQGRFSSVFLGRPLLETREDASLLAKAVLAELKPWRGRKKGLVLMGHGQEQGRAGLTFEGVRSVFHEVDPQIFMASVEGARGFDDLLSDLKASRVKQVILEPLMLVAGDHARNDLAGPMEDSWASRLKKAGFGVQANLKGLGEIEGAREIYVRHAKESQDDLTKEPRKQ